MDSGLARFAVLVVLFFLLTGDLAGIVKHLYEDAAGLGAQRQRHQRQHQTVTAEEARESPSADGDPGTDPEIEGFGKLFAINDLLTQYVFMVFFISSDVKQGDC